MTPDAVTVAQDDREEFRDLIKDAATKTKLLLDAAELKAILNALGERDENAPCRDSDGAIEPDPELRDTENGVKIIFLTTGDYPGDGKPKPVAFPDPADTSIEIDGVKFPTLEKLIELKLASGMTAPDRLKDLADVQEIIKILNLSSRFAEKLNPYVRDKFVELLKSVEHRNSNFQEQS